MPLIHTRNSFLAAVYDGNLESVKEHCNSFFFKASWLAGVPQETFNYQVLADYTALHLAVARNHVEIAKLLIAKGADINACSRDGETPLTKAVTQGSVKIVKLLLEAGASPNTKDQRDQYSLHLASAYGHPEILESLLKAGADIHLTDKDDCTSLHLVASRHHELKEIIKILLDAGSDIHAKNKNAHTPLHLASECGRLEAVKIFLEAGAAIDAKDKDGYTPLHLAARNGYQKVVALLIENNAPESTHAEAFFLALKGHKKEAAALLLDSGVDVDAKDASGNTALMLAAAEGESMDTLSFLLHRGAAIGEKNENGETALFLAEKNNKTEAANLIRSFIEERKQTEKKTFSESWARMGKDRVAFIGTYPETQKKLTEIFNFESRERLTIVEDLARGTDNVVHTHFDSLPPSFIEKALEEFNRLGGKADKNFVLRGQKNAADKKPPAPKPPGQ